MPRLMQLPRNLPLFALLCLLMLGVGGCRKKHRNVQGTVLDATTGEPVANAQVYLVNSGAGYSFPTYNVKKMVKTDAGGHFDFGVDVNTQEGLGYLWAYHPRYIAPTDGGVWSNQDGHAVVIRLQPAAYLRLHVKNVPPMQPRYIYIGIYGGGIPFDYESLDTTFVCTVPGNQPFDFHHVVGRTYAGDTPKVYYETVQMSHFDTTNFTIFY